MRCLGRATSYPPHRRATGRVIAIPICRSVDVAPYEAQPWQGPAERGGLNPAAQPKGSCRLNERTLPSPDFSSIQPDRSGLDDLPRDRLTNENRRCGCAHGDPAGTPQGGHRFHLDESDPAFCRRPHHRVDDPPVGVGRDEDLRSNAAGDCLRRLIRPDCPRGCCAEPRER